MIKSDRFGVRRVAVSRVAAITAGGVAAVAFIVGGPVLHASADGALTISAPPSANLGSGAPGSTISAILGPVTVTDDRALLSANWTVTAAETDFAAGAQTIPASDASYEPGTLVTTGVITVTPTNLTLENAAQTTVMGSGGVGDNTATWDPTVSVAVPAGAPGGVYTGTLTQSVNGSPTSTTITFTVVAPVAPHLSLTDTAPASATSGQSYSYTLQAANTGGAATAAPVQITDTLPANVQFVSAVSTAQGTSCSRVPGSGPKPKGGTVTCTVSGGLAAQASATITITVTPTKPGPVSDSATATAGSLSTTASAATIVRGS